ncbi:unnamed protein product [Caenorhabditis bovis]|uniref:Uncharacterized protein n=1 Tax=Caenorhabditis bovis TaxID=2654633 RepID=A0A8S1EPL8_9PELO|nr:unnamed protein product [Caenorhabditis bovis]
MIKFALLVVAIFAVSNARKHVFAEDSDESEEIVGGDLEVGEYCAAFNINYHYFCKGIWTPEKLKRNRRVLEKIGDFCPSYKKACVTRTDVINKEQRKKSHRKRMEEEASDLTFDEILEKLQEITPCRQSCDVRIHPHCTQKCKCDYEYDRMKDLCNVKEIDEAHHYCRTWYMLCAPYLSELGPGAFAWLGAVQFVAGAMIVWVAADDWVRS